jgi:hypothetical protein
MRVSLLNQYQARVAQLHQVGPSKQSNGNDARRLIVNVVQETISSMIANAPTTASNDAPPPETATVTENASNPPLALS